MSRGRKQSREKDDSSDIFSDSEFDASDFVDTMDESDFAKSESRTGWRRLEQLKEEKMLLRELRDFDDFEDFDD